MAIIDLRLSLGKTIAVDSMCFIYYFEANPKYGPIVKEIFTYVAAGKISATTSVITVAETLSVSLIPGENEIKTYFKERFLEMKNLRLYDVNLDIAEQAAVIRHNYSFKLGDAIQLATALKTNSKFFFTNDKQLKKINEIKVVILDDIL